MVVSDSEPSTKRRRCLIGEERKLSSETAKEGDPSTSTTTVAGANNNANKVCTIFIGGLHPRILEAHIEKMCMPYGSIQRLHLCDRKGYAFCQFATPEQASAAMQALDGRGLLGRRLMVRPAHNDQNNHPNNAHNTAASNTGATTHNSVSSNPDKERERIEAKIQALKRKLQNSQSHS